MYNNKEIIGEVRDIGMQSHDDIINWGRNYINFNFTAVKDNVITYEAFDDEQDEGNSTSANEAVNNTQTSFNSTTSEL